MTEYNIVLKPVYSETVETPKGIEIPDGWRLAWHQLETFKALQDPTTAFISFNDLDNMTFIF